MGEITVIRALIVVPAVFAAMATTFMLANALQNALQDSLLQAQEIFVAPAQLQHQVPLKMIL